MKKETPWKEYRSEGGRFRIKAEYGIDYDFGRRNKQSPHFAVTGTIEEYRGARWRDYGGGMVHRDVARHFPQLAKYLKWHLVSLESPLHYLANARYWWDMATGKGPWKRESYDPDPLEAFKSTIVFGGIEGEELLPASSPWADVKVWLDSRLPFLMENFEADMKELGVLD